MTEKFSLEAKQPPVIRTYRSSFDILRFICMVLIILIEFGWLFIPYFSLIQPFLYFSHGTLFTVYGYIVLRDGADLRKNIRHALKVFVILLAVYGTITAGYYFLTAGSPLSGLTRRGIFNFVALNIWGTPLCASIWYVQSTLYALIIFYLLRKYKKYDCLLCILLFVFSILTGELAGVIRFSFLGYTYIPGNFLTRTMPYMLLGRLIHEHYTALTKRGRIRPSVCFLIGLILCIVEFLILAFTGYLVYPNHFAGFIPMAAALCIHCVRHPSGGKWKVFGKYAPVLYKILYYTYDSLGYILLIAAEYLRQTI